MNTLVLAALIHSSGPAFAANTGPCKFTTIPDTAPGAVAFKNPPDLRAQKGTLAATLTVVYSDPSKVQVAGCPVQLRTYNGQLVGPTLRVRPGETIAVRLDNALPVQTPDQQAANVGQEQSNAFLGTTPNPYNTTNLHTHGLHVSPTGNSDNVLITVPPASSFQYEIHVPADHPTGTFWYHAHAHGGVAIQVGSGMVGAIIIEDDPAKLPDQMRGIADQVFVFESILYDIDGKADDITAFFPDDSDSKKKCEEGKSGCTWGNSGRRMLVNGAITPTITMAPNEVQRWRFIDTAFRESLSLRLVNKDGTPGPALNEIATDGNYTGRVDTWTAVPIELQPGYRSDVLVQAGATEGVYALVDDADPVGLHNDVEPQEVLAWIVVKGKPAKSKGLPTSAQMAPLAPFGNLDLSQTADGVQEVEFKIGSAYDANDTRNYFHVNNYAFNPDRVRYLQLGATEAWTLSTAGDPPNVPSGTPTGGVPQLPHIFHIHINPFQVARPGPDGTSQWVWKDTLLVPGQVNGVNSPPVQVFTTYTDYIGQFVMHCHILDHEDLGMMEVIEVVGQAPGTTP